MKVPLIMSKSFIGYIKVACVIKSIAPVMQQASAFGHCQPLPLKAEAYPRGRLQGYETWVAVGKNDKHTMVLIMEVKNFIAPIPDRRALPEKPHQRFFNKKSNFLKKSKTNKNMGIAAF